MRCKKRGKTFFALGKLGPQKICRTLGKPFEELCGTENVSKNTFFCVYNAPMKKGDEVAVPIVTGGRKLLGMARITRCEDSNPIRPRYEVWFVQEDVNWILH